MTNIGIVGAGIAGLQLGLFLQQQGSAPTIYTDKTSSMACCMSGIEHKSLHLYAVGVSAAYFLHIAVIRSSATGK